MSRPKDAKFRQDIPFEHKRVDDVVGDLLTFLWVLRILTPQEEERARIFFSHEEYMTLCCRLKYKSPMWRFNNEITEQESAT